MRQWLQNINFNSQTATERNYIINYMKEMN